MNLDVYIAKLEEIRAFHGGELTMIFASDDEGNDFSYVHYDPSCGYYNSDGEWQCGVKDELVNAVCVN
jgi:hypothetical protein